MTTDQPGPEDESIADAITLNVQPPTASDKVVTLDDLMNGRGAPDAVIEHEMAQDLDPMDGVTQMPTPEALGADRAYRETLADPTSHLTKPIVGKGRNRFDRAAKKENVAAAEEGARRAQAMMQARVPGATWGPDGIVLGTPEAPNE